MHVAQTWNPVWDNDMRETKVFGERSMQLKRLATCFVVLFGLVTASVSAFAADPENTMIITLKDGDVTVALRPDLAPKHVEQIKKLVRQGAYDNVAFHRVIDGFMAQTGDVKFGNMKNGFSADAVGTGGSDLPDLPAEFSKTERYQRGVVGMARSQDPDSANSQFFIMFAPAPPLDGQYTIVGNVENGMELVDKIKKGDAAQNGVVTDPDRMIKVRIAADGK
jgi:cyclophilin family peptidyl-prolyl cis-trans isomerase